MTINTTIDAQEIAKFAHHAEAWWNTEGPLKTLHDINPARIAFIEKYTRVAGLRVLDIGCGGGILCEGIAELGAQVTGLDVEPHAIASAKSHAQKSQLNIDYVCKPIEQYEAPAYPIITCLEMLEHVPHPERVIEHAARLLQPGGYLFLSTINRTPKAYGMVIVAAEYLLNLLPRQTHDFDKFIKPHELTRMVRQAGLETIGMAGIAYNPFTREASLQASVGVNYVIVCRKE